MGGRKNFAEARFSLIKQLNRPLSIFHIYWEINRSTGASTHPTYSEIYRKFKQVRPSTESVSKGGLRDSRTTEFLY